MTAWIEFVRWPDDDDAGHFQVRASDGNQVAQQEFYAYPVDIVAFGAALEAFPRDRSDEARFHVGRKEEGWAHWVWLTAYLYDAAGHAALIVDVGANGADPWRHSGRFGIRCEAASLNELGRAVMAWARSGEHGTLRCELHAGG